MKILRAIITFVLWGLLLFMQHITCFDIFELNLWYCYVLAAFFAILQHMLVRFVHEKYMTREMLLVCGLIYAVIAVLKLHVLLISLNYDPYPLGLSIWCIALDGASALIMLKTFHGCSQKKAD